MAENKMKEVAKLLGVEFGKPFKIKGDEYNPFIINNDGIIDCYGDEYVCKLLFLLKGILEIEQSILTEKEKCYLENVLRPFKDRVIGIEKRCVYKTTNAFIRISLSNEILSQEDILLPYFEKDKMYKYMEQYRRYTLEELGLFDGKVN